MAERLHSPSVAHAKRAISSLEFSQWVVFLRDIEPSIDTKRDQQIAHLTAEVRRGWIADKKSVKADEFLLKFEKPVTQQSERENGMNMKAKMNAFFGLKTG